MGERKQIEHYLAMRRLRGLFRKSLLEIAWLDSESIRINGQLCRTLREVRRVVE